ncbi:YpmA family protein [Alicyclobacillus sacchari]|uniref:YpmA family protein n=1 Tax=Alicyclobacillus sacchari TaxID=392010 RepID=UPI001FB9F64F|nr:YpmA family protein [Alicyclobacillus sacchari]
MELLESKLHVYATHVCDKSEDLYLLIDFLNRNLKDKDVIFGLAKSEGSPDKMQITLYRTDLE